MVGPPALRPHQKGGVLRNSCTGEGIEDRSAGAILIQKKAAFGINLQRLLERNRWHQFGQANTAGLLAALEDYSLPAVEPLDGALIKALFAALRLDKPYRADTQFRDLFKQEFETLELEQRDQQGHVRRSLGVGQRLDNPEDDVLLPGEIDLGKVQPMVIADFVALPRFDAQNLGQMTSLVALQFSRPIANLVHKETTSGHDSNVACMIAQLRGTLIEKHPNQAIVEVQGVGYDVSIPVSTYSALPGTGAEVKLKVHTHVREDAIALFGFVSQEEKSLFEKLIGVSGIGPKLAITVLSGLAAQDLITAIRSSQTDRLVRIPGVGKKTAERMVLELKDKLDGIGGTAIAASVEKPAMMSEVEMDVLSALMNLGCQRGAAETAIRKAAAAGAGGAFETLFRRAMELVR
jgi:Holliday junction DNA helicase RuvA